MTLVDTLRRMTGVAVAEYTAAGTAYWTNEQLAEVLASHVSTRLIQLPCNLIASTDDDGRTVYLHGRIPRFGGTLDVDSVEITDGRGEAIDDVTVEADGRLTFAEGQHGRTPHASGLAYDLNAAAAEVCESWAGSFAGDYDVTLDGQSFKRSQRAQNIAGRAAAFRAKALPKTVRLVRRDYRRSRRRR